MHEPSHILITGASSGIGRALALGYAATGIRLSLHGRDLKRLQEVAEKARAKGAFVSFHTGDICDGVDMEQWIASRDNEAPLDLVIANAGISGGTARGESATQVKNIFAVNVSGVFNTVQPALALMQKRGKGQIGIVSSLAGFRGFGGAPAYCASKAAVRIYGEGLRAALASQNIQINVICPGFIKTPMTDTNPFPMPFIMSAEKAALLIRKGLASNKARIVFPKRLYVIVRILTALPQSWMDAIGPHLPRK